MVLLVVITKVVDLAAVVEDSAGGPQEEVPAASGDNPEKKGIYYA
jgi:hypothetical protein